MRHVRIADSVWLPALAKARRLGVSLTSVILAGLVAFLDEPE
jgi:hypothetical protein